MCFSFLYFVLSLIWNEYLKMFELYLCFQDFIALHLRKMDLGDRETPEVTDELYNVGLKFYFAF